MSTANFTHYFFNMQCVLQREDGGLGCFQSTIF